MKIIVDQGRCTGLGICESLAPDHFEIDEDGELVVLDATVPDSDLEDVRRAVEGCPTEALRIQP